MGQNISCYVEVQQPNTDEWVLASKTALHSRLKYVLDSLEEVFNIKEYNKKTVKDVSAELHAKLCPADTVADLQNYYHVNIVDIDIFNRSLNAAHMNILYVFDMMCSTMDVETNIFNEMLDIHENNTHACIPISKKAIAQTMTKLQLLSNIGILYAISDFALDIAYDKFYAAGIKIRLVFVSG